MKFSNNYIRRFIWQINLGKTIGLIDQNKEVDGQHTDIQSEPNAKSHNNAPILQKPFPLEFNEAPRDGKVEFEQSRNVSAQEFDVYQPSFE